MEGGESSPRNIKGGVGLADRPMVDLVREIRKISIQEQPAGHMGVEEIIQQMIVENMKGGKAKEVLERFQDPKKKKLELELKPFLAPKFQDWLEQKNVLKKEPKDSKIMQVLRDRVEKIAALKRIPQDEQIFLMLMLEEGYLVSRDRLTAAIEGDRFLDNDKISDFNRRLCELQEKLESELGYLKTGKLVFTIRDAGISIGIESCNLGPQQMSFLNCLYENLGKWVPHNILLSRLPLNEVEGERGMEDELNTLRVCKRRVIEGSPEASFKIKTKHGYYMLEDQMVA